MKRLLLWLLTVIAIPVAAYMSAAWDTPARRPSLAAADLPPLIATGDFYADLNAEWEYRISDDGNYIAWRKATPFGDKVMVGRVDAINRAKSVTGDAIYGFGFLADGRFFHVRDGRIWASAATDPTNEQQDITPRGHSYIGFSQFNRDASVTVLSSDRNPAFADVFSHGPDGGSKELIEENPGDVRTWYLDGEGKPVLRIKTGEDFASILEHKNAGAWQEISRANKDTFVFPASDPDDSGHFQALSNRGRDKIVLVSMSLKDGSEIVIDGFENADISETIALDQTGTRTVDIIRSKHGFGEAKALSSDGTKFLRLVTGGREDVDWYIQSASRTEKIYLVTRSIAERSYDYVIVDLEKDSAAIVAQYWFGKAHGDKLASTKPVSFKARDGLDIKAFLTMPRTAMQTGPVPAVVLVHGGPSGADFWEYNHERQFLANRGYAVLAVNYRGSTGYGRAFLEAGYKEYAGAILNDIEDGARWLVSEGIADKEAIAVTGSSFGGYATLMLMARPETPFKVGIAHAAVSDLVYQMRNNPHRWALGEYEFRRYFDDVADPHGLEALKSGSPISHAGHVSGQLLLTHGKRDNIVGFEQTETYVQALETAGKQHRVYYFEDEGHSYGKWQTNLRKARLTETFLAETLGGRNGNYDITEFAADYF